MKGWIVGDTYFKNENEKEVLKMGGDSWTINLTEITPEIRKVEYRTSMATYNIDWDKATSRGFRRNFKEEPKLVVPKRLWNITHKEI